MNIEFRTETKGTTRKHKRCAREYKKFVLKADSLSRAQGESLRSWDPDVIVTPPKSKMPEKPKVIVNILPKNDQYKSHSQIRM